ncbi:hypothetical protein [Pseudonocardia asaccharolytica]|uniref:Tetracyclin repressor-like C-terminal domain-containing protein n=1 Tax=Pseudonocardia asaccharolytica DSM 44247 = NBRC 16224 TaxID=1123024 RepID=A0A511D6J7_9PSEU|nr:hypothetical protein [Pseudonocardia asaccharolytica]GEL19234.1 hypothetical protein PA7_30710 [Pseudonocardia asaccharolytica DSM 44247 = NBRC 16224]
MELLSGAGASRADPDARIRATCAVAMVPAGLDAWLREHPDVEGVDEDGRRLIVDCVLAVLDGATGA